MRKNNLWTVLGTLLLVILAGLLVACSNTAGGTTKPVEPYTATEDDSGLKTMTLTEKAVERLNIQVVAIANDSVPYAAVLYGLNGETYVYTNPEPLTYVRADIVVDRIEGDAAILSDGPPEGTMVVTIGGSELYGIDTGVGK
jgi:hypothetical protein